MHNCKCCELYSSKLYKVYIYSVLKASVFPTWSLYYCHYTCCYEIICKHNISLLLADTLELVIKGCTQGQYWYQMWLDCEQPTSYARYAHDEYINTISSYIGMVGRHEVATYAGAQQFSWWNGKNWSPIALKYHKTKLNPWSIWLTSYAVLQARWLLYKPTSGI